MNWQVWAIMWLLSMLMEMCLAALVICWYVLYTEFMRLNIGTQLILYWRGLNES